MPTAENLYKTKKKVLDKEDEDWYNNLNETTKEIAMNTATMFIIMLFLGFIPSLTVFRTCFVQSIKVTGEVFLFAFLQTAIVVIVAWFCGYIQ